MQSEPSLKLVWEGGGGGGGWSAAMNRLSHASGIICKAANLPPKSICNYWLLTEQAVQETWFKTNLNVDRTDFYSGTALQGMGTSGCSPFHQQ